MKYTSRRSLGLRLLASWLTVPCLVAPGAVYAQQGPPSLAEIARREQDRRKAINVPARVFTDKDVKPSPAAPSGSSVEPAAPQPVGAASPDALAAVPTSTAEAADVKGESHWRARIAEARERLRLNEAFGDALQSRINGLTADYMSRDDPYQRVKVGEEREKAVRELARVRSEIDTAKQQIIDIEEEARKAGVPPGWVR